MKLTLVFLCLVSITLQDQVILTFEESAAEEWWETSTFYYIYVKSFKDTNDDGYGDLQGVTSKLDYIKDLGVQAIILSPIFKSQHDDVDYDVTDFKTIDEIYGTNEDLKKLITEAHNKGIKVLLDFIPNHTSNKHEWYVKSESKDKEHEGYYLWNKTPNNWLSIYDSSSAWQLSETRQEYDYHLYYQHEPDLNYRNDKVKTEMEEILKFWLEEYEIDGYKMRDVSYLVEDETLADEIPIDENSKENYENYVHNHTKDQPETYQLVYDWRKLIDQISVQTKSNKIIFVDADTDLVDQVNYYGSSETNETGAHLTMNLNLLNINKDNTAGDVAKLISDWIKTIPAKNRLNWMLGTGDAKRAATRLTDTLIDGYNILMGLLPGVQVTYYGEEIGMKDDNCDTNKPDCRYIHKSPFYWENTDNAAFTSKDTSPWTSIDANQYKTCNVKDQLADANSHLMLYKKLQQIRADVRSYENVELSTLGGDNSVLRLLRSHLVSDDKYKRYEFFFNLNTKEVNVDLKDKWRSNQKWTVAMSSNSDRKANDDVKIESSISLKSHEAILLNVENSGMIFKAFGMLNLFVILFVWYV